MLIDWPRFLAALVLILTPIAVVHHRRVRFRHLDREWDGYLRRAFSLGTHYIDAGRAALGAMLLLEALNVAPGASGSARIMIFAVHAAVLGIGAMVQTFVCREAGAAHAPLAYVTGIALGFLPLIPAFFAVVFATVVVLGLRQVAVYFPVLALALGAIVFLFHGKRLQYQLIAGAGAVALPWLLTLLFPRPMMATHVARRVIDRPDPKR
jgi:hypothetical protein